MRWFCKHRDWNSYPNIRRRRKFPTRESYTEWQQTRKYTDIDSSLSSRTWVKPEILARREHLSDAKKRNAPMLIPTGRISLLRPNNAQRNFPMIKSPWPTSSDGKLRGACAELCLLGNVHITRAVFKHHRMKERISRGGHWRSDFTSCGLLVVNEILKNSYVYRWNLLKI